MYHAWAAADWRYQQPLEPECSSRTVPTGIGDLDELVGGLRPGHLWVVTGDSGAGKSVFAAQLAANAATQHAVDVVLAALREPPRLTWDRMVSATSRAPLPGPAWSGSPYGEEDATDESAREYAEDRLRRSGLWLTHDATEVPVYRWVSDGVLARARLLVIDDLDRAGPTADPQLLAAWARARQATAVVTLPPHRVYHPRQDAPWGTRLQWPWTDCADVVAELRWPDQQQHPGEVQLQVLRHRWGPVARLTLVFVGWRSCFTQPDD